MATLTSGDTLSLNGLASATGQTTKSLSAAKGNSTGPIAISSFAIDSVGALSGFTYAVEQTSETYTLGFGGAGGNFTRISTRANNFTWSVPVGDKITLGTNSGATATFTVANMDNDVPQTTLQTIVTHTLRVVFADGFNDHATDYNVAKNKTVYSVDTYDGNTSLCLTSDSPIMKADGTIVEVGLLEEGDLLKGFSVDGLSEDSDSNFMDWNAENLVITPKDVTVVNVVYSFAQRYYSINDGEITATAEHPLMVKDLSTGLYKFKEVFKLVNGDKLIKWVDSGVQEVEIVSIVPVNETTEIVSLDVEAEDTYLVNGYVTHNKGGNTHTDLTASAPPSSLSYSSPSLSWVAPASSGTTGITAYDFQIDNNSDFSSPIANVTEWSSTSVEVLVGYGLSPGTTYYARVRAIDHGLKSNYTSTLTFVA